jgi:cytochrome c553
MRKVIFSIALAGWLAAPLIAAELPDWCYPAVPTVPPSNATLERALPDSSKKYTEAEIDDRFNPPDWYPQDHPPMPEVVAHGRRPSVFACTSCHLTSGGGHPESAGISGLSAEYLRRQTFEFRSGVRHGPGGDIMVRIAKDLTDQEVASAAAYFASIKYPTWYRVVEDTVVPKSYVGKGAMRFPVKSGGSEPLGNRIIELPQDEESARSRDPRVGFVAHVPPGSIAKGSEIVTTGAGGRIVACASCHGPELKGSGDAPPIVGRSPIYVYRQLNDFKNGTRDGAMAPQMKAVVDPMDSADMLAISAFLATRTP